MQRRSQRIAGDDLLSRPRRELLEPAGRVLDGPLQHIDQIVVGFDVVQAAGADQTEIAEIGDRPRLPYTWLPSQWPLRSFANWCYRPGAEAGNIGKRSLRNV